MCTGVRFTDASGNMFWGRNFDWNERYGEIPLVMPKGFVLERAFGQPEPAKHAAVGMSTQFNGYPLFFNCGNDAGLAVGGLNFAGYAKFADAPVEGKTNIAAYEFPAWVGANFATVDEVEAALRDTVVVAKAIDPGLPVAMLHWMVADAKRSIVAECQADGLHVYEDDVDVLTNQPPFPWHMENLRNYMNCGNQWAGTVTWDKHAMTPFGSGSCMRGIPGDTYATSRFVRAAYTNAFYPKKETEHDNVVRMLHTLGNVSMVEGNAAMEDGSFEMTLFSDCYSAATCTYYFNTYDDPCIQAVRLHDYDGAPADALIAAKVERL